MTQIIDCPDNTEVRTRMTQRGKRFIASNPEINNNAEFSGRCPEIACAKLLKEWNIKEFDMNTRVTKFKVDSLDVKCLKLFIIEFFNKDQSGFKIKTDQDVMFYELAHDLYNHLIEIESKILDVVYLKLTPAYFIVIKNIYNTATGKTPAIVKQIIYETPVKLQKLK